MVQSRRAADGVSGQFEHKQVGGGGPRSNILRLVIVVAVCGVGLAGCGDGVRTHGEGGGLLSVHVAGGGTSLDPPGHTPWYGSFGGFRPCVTQPVSVVIDRVEPHVDDAAPPLGVRVLYRSVTLETTEDHDGFLSAIGVPPDVDHGRMRGDFTADVGETEVSLPCSDVTTEGVQLGELYFTLEADEAGARIESATIHYHEPGKDQRYALEVNWEMVACGHAIDDDIMC